MRNRFGGRFVIVREGGRLELRSLSSQDHCRVVSRFPLLVCCRWSFGSGRVYSKGKRRALFLAIGHLGAIVRLDI